MSNISKDNKRNFLLRFFKQDKEQYESLEINGFVLVKHWDGNMQRWSVDIFTPESFLAMKERKKLQRETLF